MESGFVRMVGFMIVTLFLIIPSFRVAAEPIELDGVIEPHMIVKIGSPLPGILETVRVDRGDMVKKDQVLATLQSGVERATMELARERARMDSTIKAREARLEFNFRKQKRLEKLEKSSAIPFEQMDEARTNSKIALLELEEAKDNKRLAEFELRRSMEVVKRMTIYSPITGVVMERFLLPGEYVEDQPIVQLAQIDPLNVEVFAPVNLLESIMVDMVAEVRPERPGGGVFEARVKIVDRAVDAASGTFGVRLELPNPEYRLPAGLKCKAIFMTKFNPDKIK
jgi:RND family efflux transporter MFP subunit